MKKIISLIVIALVVVVIVCVVQAVGWNSVADWFGNIFSKFGAWISSLAKKPASEQPAEAIINTLRLI